MCDGMGVNSLDRPVDVAPRMEQIAFRQRQSDADAASHDACRYYVVDDQCNVKLVGTSPNDLAPVQDRDVRLPLDVDRAVRKVVATETFDGGAARASTASKSLRVLMLSGPAVTFYGIVARERSSALHQQAS